MPGAVIPEILADVMRLWSAGDRDAATALHDRWLPLLNWENKHTGLQTAKILMLAGGIIASDAVREPLEPASPALREGLLRLARRLDPLILRWDGRINRAAAGSSAPT